MYKAEMEIPDPMEPGQKARITSLVMSQEEFDELIVLIRGGDPVTEVRSGQRMSPEDVQRLADAKQVPMVARGTLTEFLFKRYDVQTPYFCATVRGLAKRMGLDPESGPESN